MPRAIGNTEKTKDASGISLPLLMEQALMGDGSLEHLCGVLVNCIDLAGADYV